jgi:hypothetical protein
VAQGTDESKSIHTTVKKKMAVVRKMMMTSKKNYEQNKDHQHRYGINDSQEFHDHYNPQSHKPQAAKRIKKKKKKKITYHLFTPHLFTPPYLYNIHLNLRHNKLYLNIPYYSHVHGKTPGMDFVSIT